ncbi:MAG: T9SS type A sorting domain-containing protein [Flavobacterium sp. JAD_PAG50586_2]|nr:MAG: T9SS type A sorting domain-containing protein [Flavobacterium sp. JAD_PAG50586_2]
MNVGGLGNVTFVEFNGYLPIALDNDNDLIFTGTFRQQIDLDASPTGTTLVNSSSINPSIAGVFIAKYDNPITVCTLSNTDFEENKFIVYPNPSNGLVTISTKRFQESAVVNVYDITGKKLLSEKINNEVTTFDLGYFTKGIYIIELNNGNKNFHQKLILQ